MIIQWQLTGANYYSILQSLNFLRAPVSRQSGILARDRSARTCELSVRPRYSFGKAFLDHIDDPRLVPLGVGAHFSLNHGSDCSVLGDKHRELVTVFQGRARFHCLGYVASATSTQLKSQRWHVHDLEGATSQCSCTEVRRCRVLSVELQRRGPVIDCHPFPAMTDCLLVCGRAARDDFGVSPFYRPISLACIQRQIR